MALDQYSLATLIQQQMGVSAQAPDAVPMHSGRANYLWNALGSDLRRARDVSRMVARIPEPGRASASECLRHLEAF